MLVKVKPEIVCGICKEEIKPYEEKHMVDGRAVAHQGCHERAEADHIDRLIDDSKL